MKIGVVGLWHLGTVAAACFSELCDQVIAVDDPAVVANLVRGQLPVNEPGLAELTAAACERGVLRFSDRAADLADVDLLLIAYDTPVDDNDRADVGFVESRLNQVLPQLKDGATVVISSQLPVGFTNRTAAYFRQQMPGKTLHFAYSPENLRLGKAIQCFKQPDRIVVGTDSPVARACVEKIFGQLTNNFVWMSPTSAEMTKHALNAFLGLSIAFINEVATLCEAVGADAREVERGLKSEERIGPRAPLSPGGAFAGGTLARDISYLVQVGSAHDTPTALLSAIRVSNEEHKTWALRRLQHELGDLCGKVVAVLGLTYKPGTDTLRRSSALELCRALTEAGSQVRAHDPSVAALPPDFAAVRLTASAAEAYAGAGAVVLATAWPEYRNITASQLVEAMEQPLVLDANGFLRESLDGQQSIRYVVVGKGCIN
jgi:UDPglucose 6-dehydrogenase